MASDLAIKLHALINSRPYNPTLDEIDALVLRAQWQPRPNERCTEWNDALAAYLDVVKNTDDDRTCDAADRTSGMPAFANSCGYPSCAISETEPVSPGLDELALAYLTRAILKLMGAEFDEDGRIVDDRCEPGPADQTLYRQIAETAEAVTQREASEEDLLALGAQLPKTPRCGADLVARARVVNSLLGHPAFAVETGQLISAVFAFCGRPKAT
jgi:hypothetical protein